MAMKLLCTGMAKMGKPHTLGKPQLQNVMQDNSGYICIYVSKGHFGKTETSIEVQVTKANGEWKVRNFHMDSLTKI